MDYGGKGKQPDESVASSTSSTSQALGGTGTPTSQTLRGTGSGSSEQVGAVHREVSGSGSGSGEQVGVVHREMSLDSLVLSLSPPVFPDDLNNILPPPPPPPPPPAPVPRPAPVVVVAAARAAQGGRRHPPWNPTIPPPYPWATNRRAMVHSLEYLLSKEIYTITGDVSCKKCKSNFTLEFDLLSKFNEVKEYIICNRDSMHDRAPERWTNPALPICKSCEYPNALRPTFGKKRTINWLFLLLGQMLGSCGITQLKYFCKHTNNHRTGAKNRLLFLAYLGICKQLQDIPAFHYHTNN